MPFDQSRLQILPLRQHGGDAPIRTHQIGGPTQNARVPFPRSQIGQEIRTPTRPTPVFINVHRHISLVSRNIRMVPRSRTQEKFFAILQLTTAFPLHIGGLRERPQTPKCKDGGNEHLAATATNPLPLDLSACGHLAQNHMTHFRNGLII